MGRPRVEFECPADEEEAADIRDRIRELREEYDLDGGVEPEDGVAPEPGEF